MNLYKLSIRDPTTTMAASGPSLILPNLDFRQVNPLQEDSGLVDLRPHNMCKSLWFKHASSTKSVSTTHFLFSAKPPSDPPHIHRTKRPETLGYHGVLAASMCNLFVITRKKKTNKQSQPNCISSVILKDETLHQNYS